MPFHLFGARDADRFALFGAHQQLPQTAPVLEGIQRALQHLVTREVLVGGQQPEGGIIRKQAMTDKRDAATRELKVVGKEDVKDRGEAGALRQPDAHSLPRRTAVFEYHADLAAA